MKQRFLLLLLCCLFLTACGGKAPTPESTAAPTTFPVTVPESTAAPAVPTEQPATEAVPPTTEEPLSAFHIEGVSVEEVILYFNEVCLDAEFVHGGDPSLLQKWMKPIFFTVYGQPTEEDLKTLYSFTEWLNTIEGFPGIQETTDPALENLRIHFCTEGELTELMGPDYVYMDGAVTFWYLENAIYDAIICCRNDIDQELRNSVILEELYNGLGPVQDTDLREDSIIYSGFSQPQKLTEMDELILKLLYHPSLECGMDRESCEAQIRQLYN